MIYKFKTVFCSTDGLTYITDSGEGVTDVSHRVVDEGDVREVGGEGVPPGGKRGFPQAVPEDSQSLPLSPKHTHTDKHTSHSAEQRHLFSIDGYLRKTE